MTQETGERDYEKYAYFRSKAKNFAVSMRPYKEKMVDGIKEVTEGLRLEFHNGMLRVEKTEENKGIIKFLRDRIKTEKGDDPRRRQIFEDEVPQDIIEKKEAEKKIADQEKEIERLRLENEKMKEANKNQNAGDKK